MGSRKVFLKLGKRLNNVLRLFLSFAIALILGCSQDEEKRTQGNSEANLLSDTIVPRSEVNHDTTVIYKRYSDYGLVEDFNGDQYPESVSLVANSKTNEIGVRIVDGKNSDLVWIFGAGNEFDGTRNLRWIKMMESIPSGFYISPTLFDSISGDIIGLDSAQGFVLQNLAFQVAPEESHVSKVFYWDGTGYSCIHRE